MPLLCMTAALVQAQLTCAQFLSSFEKSTAAVKRHQRKAEFRTPDRRCTAAASRALIVAS